MTPGKFIEELLKARGSDKESVLRKAFSKDIQEILWYTYNKDITYGVIPGAVSAMSVIGRQEGLSEEEKTLLENLRNRKLTGSAAELMVRRVIAERGPLLSLILNRDLQCGIAAKTINKAIPGLIPEFNIQLAKEVPLDKVKYPCWAQLKFDGVRIVAVVKDGNVTFKTRNNKVVNMPVLRDTIRTSIFSDCILDGELVYGKGKTDSRTSISGAVNSAIHGGTMDEDNVVFNVFDCMSYYDFSQCECTTAYSARYDMAKIAVQTIDNNGVILADNMIVNNAKDVNDLVDILYSSGYEGLILKHPSHKYTFKRSKDWVKIKQILDVDLYVESANEGEGKYEGMVGALNCSGVINGTPIKVAVGSGLTDSQRDVPLDYYNGSTVEVKYNGVIQDSQTKQWSLFLPRFVRVRFDK